ncbi:MAG: PqqD family protein, partial [Deltaproteobacteria bacterium]|nr:PqqD family protein [Deltaproteobacteria bacterium]
IALWTALENGTDTEEELVRHLTGSFEVLPERAAADVAVFLGELRRRGLVLETG